MIPREHFNLQVEDKFNLQHIAQPHKESLDFKSSDTVPPIIQGGIQVLAAP